MLKYGSLYAPGLRRSTSVACWRPPPQVIKGRRCRFLMVVRIARSTLISPNINRFRELKREGTVFLEEAPPAIGEKPAERAAFGLWDTSTRRLARVQLGGQAQRLTHQAS